MAEPGPDCSALLDEELSSFVFNYLTDSQVRLSAATASLQAHTARPDLAGAEQLLQALRARLAAEGGGRLRGRDTVLWGLRDPRPTMHLGASAIGPRGGWGEGTCPSRSAMREGTWGGESRICSALSDLRLGGPRTTMHRGVWDPRFAWDEGVVALGRRSHRAQILGRARGMGGWRVSDPTCR